MYFCQLFSRGFTLCVHVHVYVCVCREWEDVEQVHDRGRGGQWGAQEARPHSLRARHHARVLQDDEGEDTRESRKLLCLTLSHQYTLKVNC